MGQEAVSPLGMVSLELSKPSKRLETLNRHVQKAMNGLSLFEMTEACEGAASDVGSFVS
jgi:hypothetical protein